MVLANADPAFDAEAVLGAAASARPGLLLDCWRRWAAHLDRFPDTEYVAVGRSLAAPDAREALARMVCDTLPLESSAR